jgi:hypothetical protein
MTQQSFPTLSAISVKGPIRRVALTQNFLRANTCLQVVTNATVTSCYHSVTTSFIYVALFNVGCRIEALISAAF